MIDPNFAEVLGFLCAEGCHIIQHSSYWGNDKGKRRYYKNKKSERIEVYSKDINLLMHHKKLLDLAFRYEVTITKDNKINIANRKIIREIIFNTEIGHLKWRVPASIKCANLLVKKRFVRGFFDGDGTSSNIIRFFSTNKPGLLEISELLLDLGFKSTFQGPIVKPNRKPSYVLQISRGERETFLNTINPVYK